LFDLISYLVRNNSKFVSRSQSILIKQKGVFWEDLNILVREIKVSFYGPRGRDQ